MIYTEEFEYFLSPGSIVVCIDDEFDLAVAANYNQLPTLDEVYTIECIIPLPQNIIAVTISELKNNPIPVIVNGKVIGASMATFTADRFMPIGHYLYIIELFNGEQTEL
jgi:hypothetical protein